jgi:hypothetical protein
MKMSEVRQGASDCCNIFALLIQPEPSECRAHHASIWNAQAALHNASVGIADFGTGFVGLVGVAGV